MNDTENYLARLRASRHGRILYAFLVYLALFGSSFALSYLLFSVIPCGSYMIACDVSGGGILNNVKNAVLSQSGCAVILLAVYLSAFSSFSGAVSSAVCLWRGLCLGCASALFCKDSVGGLSSSWRVSLCFYLASTVGIIVYASITALYSPALTHTSSCGEKRYFRALSPLLPLQKSLCRS